ncbi:hypothetical protein K9N68_17385 [Kovacikia minuta CCNUW1]|uniref:hypothetical protein n=1 Tax=Kovacikia minuta TaxID=2931930 RepID=UPI001CCB57D1|nr:hypothetical protein [Kovacikia minuta]UBF23563.1 hypothetical protein K9N68_17385 [Kovacikia minuta CCNUW1]
MQAPLISSSLVHEVVDRILDSRKITRKDQHLLLSLNILSPEERSLLNQVFDRLQMGLLRVVD